ncbi:MAG TPA: hypothetical protein VFK13_08570 [Gemmatimonadaceae bacterium]|nr:hypothetical protein [Gemmatimonadaceae bacterium]
MRILWTLLKIIIGLAIAIPLGIVALALTLGILGGLFGLAVLALKLAVVGVVGYGLYKVARFFFSPSPKPSTPPVHELTAPDRYYEAAMRELDEHMGTTPRR